MGDGMARQFALILGLATLLLAPLPLAPPVAQGQATTPSFAAASSFPAGSVSRGLATADVNGDGKLDLVVGNYSSNNVSVLLNTTAPGATTATFAAAVNFMAGISPHGVATGDLNGDGKPD